MLVTGHYAHAGWMAKADFSSCPRKYYPQLSAEEGPFSSIEACNAKVAQAKNGDKAYCIKYSCTEQAGGTAGAAGGAPMDGHIANALSAGMSGQISGTDAMGLMSMGILGNALLAPSTPETPQQAAARIENQRIYAEQQAKWTEEARQKELAYQMEQDSKSMALLDLAAGEFQPPSQPVEVSQAFTQGFEHAGGCISQNSGAACAGSKSDTCISDYRAGYDAGKKKFNLLMEEAFQEGKRAGAKGDVQKGGASPNAVGPCRYEWIQQYDKGHWAGKHPKAKL